MTEPLPEYTEYSNYTTTQLESQPLPIQSPVYTNIKYKFNVDHLPGLLYFGIITLPFSIIWICSIIQVYTTIEFNKLDPIIQLPVSNPVFNSETLYHQVIFAVLSILLSWLVSYYINCICGTININDYWFKSLLQSNPNSLCNLGLVFGFALLGLDLVNFLLGWFWFSQILGVNPFSFNTYYGKGTWLLMPLVLRMSYVVLWWNLIVYCLIGLFLFAAMGGGGPCNTC
jgi:hypothetical protein